MSLVEHLQQQIYDAIAVQEEAAEALSAPLAQAVQRIVHSLMNDGRIWVCGSGATAALAQLFALCLVHRLEAQRPALPAVCLAGDAALLTGIAGDGGLERIYARQLEALGAPADLLLILAETGEEPPLCAALQCAQDKSMGVIVLTGHAGGRLAEALRTEDQLIVLPAHAPARVRESMLLALHCLCEGIDHSLLGA
ncbi:MAG: SIS domain-containing protein [Thiobacillaceae bacterium]|nr:SIS domain-containing protein [Thiobacillaceae bacterium]